MDEETKNGYVAGIGCLFIFLIFLAFSINNEFNLSGQILWIMTIIFGGLTFGSFWKPDTFGQAVAKFLENWSKSEDDKTVYKPQSQLQQNSSGAIQAMSTTGNINISMNSQESKDSKNLEIYSLIHSMIIRVNKEVPRKVALQLSAGAWVKDSVMDFDKISELFNQHSDKFRDKDLHMWLDIENELKTKNGFFLGKDRQKWFDFLEAEYKRLKKS